MISDITARRQAEERIEHLTYHDGVTGLTNRQMFTEHLELALARADRQGLLVAVLRSTSTVSSWSTTASGWRPATSCCGRPPTG